MNLDPLLVYADEYNIRVGGLEKLHKFDSCKYGRAFELLQQQVDLADRQVTRPVWPTDEDLLRVHTAEYLAGLKTPATVAQVIELDVVAWLPAALIERALLTPMRWAVGGTMVAVREAPMRGLVVNLSGGYHHARSDFGHGFCVYADVAIALSALRAEGRSPRTLVIDLDAHQGDGNAYLFADDPQVALFDMYNALVFPGDAQAIERVRWAVPLMPRTGDEEYLGLLAERLPAALDEWRPELAIYNAGTDIVADDPLGGLAVSAAGVFERDRFVLQQLAGRGIPAVMLPSGGYTHESHRLIARTLASLFPLRATG